MPIINPPITNDVEDDSYNQQVIDLLRYLENQTIVLEKLIAELDERVTALE